MYNDSGLINSTTIFDNFNVINNATTIPNFFAIMILIVLFLIFFIGAMGFLNFSKSITFSSFVISIISALFWAIGEINQTYVIISIVVFIIGLFFIVFGEN